VADRRDQPIVLVGVEKIGRGAQGFHQSHGFVDRIALGAREWCQAPHCAIEQLRVRGVWAALGFACHRVATYKAHAIWQQVSCPVEHLRLGTAGVHNQRVHGQQRPHFLEQRFHRADRG